MVRPRTWGRIALGGLFVLTVLAAALLFALRHWSASLVRPELERALGPGVTIASASLGVLGDTTISGLSVPDPGQAKPLVTVKSASTDVSVFGSHAPSRISLEGGRVRLRFDKDGGLLTRLPQGPSAAALPLVDLRDLTLELAQEGRAPFVLQGIDLKTARGRGSDTFSGSIRDPEWGTFDVSGSLRTEPAELSLQLGRKDAALHPALLRSIPFIPSDVWDLIEARSTAAPVVVRLRLAETAPHARYEVEFADVSLALQQKDRPAFPVKAARGKIVGDEVTGFTLVGKLNDPDWGTWDAQVGMTASDGAVTVKLGAGPTPVTPAKLATLPFVPPSVWQQVQATGTTTAQVLVRVSTTQVRHRVELHPTKATVHVSSIDLDLSHVAGKVVIEDGLVTLEKMTGVAATGTVALSSELDFRATPTRMRFNVIARHLDVRSLPASWDLNKGLDGKVSGMADLQMVVRDGRLETRGTGKGRVDEAVLGGFKVKNIIDLELTADGRRFRLRPRVPPLGALLFGVTMLAAPPPPPELLPQSPTDLAARLAGGITKLAGLAASATGRGLDALSELERSTRPDAETTYLNANFALDDVDLVQLGERFGTPLPAGIRGKVNVRVQARIPLNNATDAKAYRVAGDASSKRLELAGIALEEVKAKVAYASGVATLSRLTAQVPGRGKTGSVTGSVRAGLFPPGDLSLSVDLSRVPLNALGPVLPDHLRRGAEGEVSGRLTLAAPLNKAGDETAWRGLGRLHGEGLAMNGIQANNAVADLALAAGTLLATDVRTEAFRALFTGTAGLNLRAPYRYTATVRARGLDLAQPPFAVSGLVGSVDASGKLEGLLGRMPTGEGRLRTQSLRFAGVHAGLLASRWSIGDGKVALTEIEGTLEGGKLTGSAQLPGEVRLRLAGASVRALARWVPGLNGTLDADLKAALAAGRDGVPALTDLDADLSGSKLRLGRAPVQNLRANAKMLGRKLTYTASLDALGGRATLEGKYPPPPMGSVGQPHGRLRIDRLRLGALAGYLGRGAERRVPVRGVLSLDMPFRHEGQTSLPAGEGRFEVRDLRYGGSDLAESIRGDVRLRGGTVSLREATGTLAGGLLRLRAGYRLEARERGWFDLSLSGAESSRLLALADAESRAKGPVDIRMRGNLGTEWRGSGTVVLRRGEVLGVETTEWSAPLDFAYIPERGYGEIHVRESSAQLGGGRARVRGDVLWGESARVEATVQLNEASLKSLSGLVGDVSSYARGRLTGRITIGGNEVRSENDLTAEVQGTLREAQALQLPVLRLFAPFLGPGQSSTVFSSGEVRGRLAGGVFRIKKLTLQSAIAQLMVTGSTTTAGRLDLEVVARTSIIGRGNSAVARAVLRRIPAVGPVPVGLIVQLAELLSDRVIYLKVSGSTRNPVVQVQPLRLLTDEAARFLIDRLLVP